jgi:hypothetical protein
MIAQGNHSKATLGYLSSFLRSPGSALSSLTSAFRRAVSAYGWIFFVASSAA